MPRRGRPKRTGGLRADGNPFEPYPGRRRRPGDARGRASLFVVWLCQAGGDQDKKYDILFSQAVDGLAKGSAVTFSGVPVGQVESINLMPKTPEFVRVRISVDEENAGARRHHRDDRGRRLHRSRPDPARPARPRPARPPGRRPIVCPEVNRDAQCPYGVPLIPTKPGALGQLLSSAPELLERVSTLTARLTELLGDRNQNSIAAILENVQVISRNLAERSDEIAATLAEARIAIRQTGNRGRADGPARRHHRPDCSAATSGR